jgi:hypothetical protein
VDVVSTVYHALQDPLYISWDRVCLVWTAFCCHNWRSCWWVNRIAGDKSSVVSMLTDIDSGRASIHEKLESKPFSVSEAWLDLRWPKNLHFRRVGLLRKLASLRISKSLWRPLVRNCEHPQLLLDTLSTRNLYERVLIHGQQIWKQYFKIRLTSRLVLHYRSVNKQSDVNW